MKTRERVCVWMRVTEMLLFSAIRSSFFFSFILLFLGETDDLTNKKLTTHESVVSILAQICFPMSWLVTTVTWGLLYPWVRRI